MEYCQLMRWITEEEKAIVVFCVIAAWSKINTLFKDMFMSFIVELLFFLRLDLQFV